MATIDIKLTINVVNDNNTAPQLEPIGRKAVGTGNTLEFTIAATDAENDALTFTVTGLPAGFAFDEPTRTVTGSSATAVTSDVTATVSDGALQDSETFELAVADVCPGTRQQLTLSMPTSTNYEPGQPPSAAINGVVNNVPGVNDPPGSSNWLASNGDAVDTFSLGGMQCVDELRVHWLENNGNEYDRAVYLLDENDAIVDTVVARGFTTPRSPGEPEVFSVPAVQAAKIRVERFGGRELDGTATPWSILQEIEAHGVELVSPGGAQSDLHTPLFESVSSGAKPRYDVAGQNLPANVGETTTQAHPHLPYEIRITKVNDAATTEALNGGVYTPNHTMNEYAIHPAWDASGQYLITHGNNGGNRLLYDGRTYNFIRSVGPRMVEFQWHPVTPGIGYFLDPPSNLLRSYNAITDTYTTLFNVATATIPLDVGGSVTGLDMPNQPMGGGGAISVDGTMIAFRADDGGDGIIIAFDLTTNTVAHALRVVNGGGEPNAGSPTVAHATGAVDFVQVAPDKSGVTFAFRHSGHNNLGPYVGGAAVDGGSVGEGDWRFYPFSDFRIANGDSSVSLNPEADHCDLGIGVDGNPISIEDRGEFHNLSTGLQIGNIWTDSLFVTSGTAYPATHVAFPGNGDPYIMLSAYRGGSTVDSPPMLAFKAEAGGDVAWMGNPNLCNSHFNYYTAQSKASLSTRVQYADGITGWKVAFSSSDGDCANGTTGGNFTRATASRVGALYVAEVWRTDV